MRYLWLHGLLLGDLVDVLEHVSERVERGALGAALLEVAIDVAGVEIREPAGTAATAGEA